MMSAYSTGKYHPETTTPILHQPTSISRGNTQRNLQLQQDPSLTTRKNASGKQTNHQLENMGPPWIQQMEYRDSTRALHIPPHIYT